MMVMLTGVLFAAGWHDVVINEVAWMGTDASGTDEWIELCNNTTSQIDLTDWEITGSGLDANGLSGSISATGYYLIENDEEVVRDVDGDNIDSSISLSDQGATLILRDKFDNEIDQVDCSEGWFAGDKDIKISMERIDPEKSGTESGNWATNDLTKINGEDDNGNDIFGTPRKKNSVYGKTIYTASDILEIKPSLIFPFGDASPSQSTEAGIYYNVESGAFITIKIFNTNGNLIKTLANSKRTNSATGNYSWIGTDSKGEKVPMGVYIVHIKAVDSNGDIETGQAIVTVGRNFNR